MENKENKNKDGKDDCCQSGCCCGGRRCCSGRTALALVLLLIGALIGYGAGRCHSARLACHYGMNCPEMSAPAMPAKK